MIESLRLVRCRRDATGETVSDPVAAATAAVDRLELGDVAGRPVALLLGSRKLAQAPEIARAVIAAVRARGGVPYVVPAMGSHGGATAEGQRQSLERLGLGGDDLGVAVESAMATDRLGVTRSGVEVHAARAVAHAGAILAINRVRPHTAFGGRIGSGLVKMLAVGIGQQPGARAIHAAGLEHGLERVLVEVAAVVCRELPVVGGVAVIENAAGAVARVAGVRAGELPEAEHSLLELARQVRPGLGIDRLDLLVLDRMGKDIAGTGMDPWVVGRLLSDYSPEPAGPRVRRLYVRSLTAASGGNAHGVGLADLVHARLAEAIDWSVTRTNALTAGAPQKARLPLVMTSDREALEAALTSAGVVDIEAARVLWAEDTSHLDRVRVSAGLVAEAGAAGWQATGEPELLRFDPGGDVASA